MPAAYQERQRLTKGAFRRQKSRWRDYVEGKPQALRRLRGFGCPIPIPIPYAYADHRSASRIGSASKGSH